MEGPQIIEHASQSVNFTPFEAKWVPSSARIAVCGIAPRGHGVINVMEMKEGKLQTVLASEKKEGIKCATFGASLHEQRHLATGDHKGRLAIYDLEAINTPVFSVQAHSSIINCIDGVGGLNTGYGAPELATGGRDGCVKIWDPRQQLPVASLEPAEGETARDCWSVAFGNSYDDDNRSVCCGYDNGDVKMLDLRTNKLVWETNVKNGVVGLEFDRRDIEMNKMVVTSLESTFRVYDMRTKHPEEGYAFHSEKATHKSTIWLGKHLPQNRDLWMTTGGNGTLNMYKYSYPAQRRLLDKDGFAKGVMGTVSMLSSRRVAEQPIVSLDWNVDKTGLACMAALDQCVRVLFVTGLQSA